MKTEAFCLLLFLAGSLAFLLGLAVCVFHSTCSCIVSRRGFDVVHGKDVADER